MRLQCVGCAMFIKVRFYSYRPLGPTVVLLHLRAVVLSPLLLPSSCVIPCFETHPPPRPPPPPFTLLSAPALSLQRLRRRCFYPVSVSAVHRPPLSLHYSPSQLFKRSSVPYVLQGYVPLTLPVRSPRSDREEAGQGGQQESKTCGRRRRRVEPVPRRWSLRAR